MELLMKIKNFSYFENKDKPNYWEVSETSFADINLVVGKNATGKSRLINVIRALSDILSGRIETFSSGTFQLTLEVNESIYEYHVSFIESGIEREFLKVDNVSMFERNSSGDGAILFEELGNHINFKVPHKMLVAVSKRDDIQHSFLGKLNEWALSVAAYNFGSEFGHKNLLGNLEIDHQSNLQMGDSANLISVYAAGFKKFSHPFDEAIINDMRKMGYEINDVGACNIQDIQSFPFAAFTIYVTEDELGFKNPQAQLSQGMYRALALAIHLNYCSFSKSSQLILIDDIGEGLDYERATSIIGLLMERSRSDGIQLIMTSNDRFVMNKVPLEYWSVMQRSAGVVKVYNYENSKEKFDSFKYVGLNNFDFFTSDFLSSPIESTGHDDFDYGVDEFNYGN